MEVFWPRLIKNITYIKDQIQAIKFKVNPYDESPRSQIAADVVAASVENMVGDELSGLGCYEDMIGSVVDAYGHGITAQELIYDKADGFLLPKGALPISGATINAYPERIDVGGIDWKPLNKLVIAVYRNRTTTNLSQFGVYQTLAPLYSYFQHAFNWQMSLAEKYGIPFRAFTYPPNTVSQLEAQTLATAMSNYGANGYIVMPEGGKLEHISVDAKADKNPQSWIIDYCDRAADIVMLGQNLSSENDGGSLAANKTANEKEGDIISAIAKFVLRVLNNQFVTNILAINDLPLNEKPYFTLDTQKDLDLLAKKMTAMTQAQSLGIVIDQEELKKELQEYGMPIDMSAKLSDTIGNEAQLPDEKNTI